MGTSGRGHGLSAGLDEAWESYRTLCKGKLIEKRRQGPLSAAAATMALRAAEGPWGDPHSTCGSWLERLRAADARAAERVTEAVRGFSFIEVPVRPTRPTTGEVAAVTVGGAAALAGLGATADRLLGLGMGVAGPAVAAAAGALLAGGAAQGVRDRARRAAGSDLLDAYLEQLELLHQEIAGIVPDEA